MQLAKPIYIIHAHEIAGQALSSKTVAGDTS